MVRGPLIAIGVLSKVFYHEGIQSGIAATPNENGVSRHRLTKEFFVQEV
jgi:hypothetical protein